MSYWNFERERSTTLRCVILPLKYLDCLHKVCGGDQLRILPSVFNTQNVCTSVVMILVRSRSVFTNIVMNNFEHVVINTIDRGQYIFNDLLNFIWKSFNKQYNIAMRFALIVHMCNLDSPVMHPRHSVSHHSLTEAIIYLFQSQTFYLSPARMKCVQTEVNNSNS